MSKFLSKALRAFGGGVPSGAGVNPAAVIRSALASAGLTPPGASSDLSPNATCLAPAGLAASLEGLMGNRRNRDARDLAPADPRFTWESLGGRRYRLFVPETGTAPVALVVMLHGCTQDPDDFAAGTRMNAVAAELNVVVAYPEQTRSANQSRCWNWFEPAHQRRGGGEPASIAAITTTLAKRFSLPASRCFVAGLSAGGAMAAIMAETYPDLFGAVGIHSGLPFGAASDLPSAFAAMGGRGLRAAVGPMMPLPAIVFHGDADHTVNVANADALVARLGDAASLLIDEEKGRSTGGERFRRLSGRDKAGRLRFEDWRLFGAGHAWAGGSAEGTYTDPAGPDASRAMAAFFLGIADAAHREPAAATM